MGACEKCCSFPIPAQVIAVRTETTRALMRSNGKRLKGALLAASGLSFVFSVVTFDFFAILLAMSCLISMISASFHSSNGSMMTAGFLVLLTSGLNWWNGLIMLFSSVCNPQPLFPTGLDSGNYSNTNNADHGPYPNDQLTNVSSTALDNSTTKGELLGSDMIGEDNDAFLCSHETWILSCTLIAALLWTVAGIILLLQPPPTTGRPPIRDDTTVASCDDPNDDDDVSHKIEHGNASQSATNNINQDAHQVPQTVIIGNNNTSTTTAALAMGHDDDHDVDCNEPPVEIHLNEI